MPNVKEMAEAHLNNVAKAIEELVMQKQNIEQEIEKLTSYLNEGKEEVGKLDK